MINMIIANTLIFVFIWLVEENRSFLSSNNYEVLKLCGIILADFNNRRFHWKVLYFLWVKVVLTHDSVHVIIRLHDNQLISIFINYDIFIIFSCVLALWMTIIF